MNKNERQLTIMMSLRYNRCNGMTEPAKKAISTAYDVARVQAISQPQAWRLLNDLVTRELVERIVFSTPPKDTIFYTLTKKGHAQLKSRHHALNHAQDILIRYKTDRYRKGLMT